MDLSTRCKSARVRLMHPCRECCTVYTMAFVAQIWSLMKKSQISNMQMMWQGHSISLTQRASQRMQQMAVIHQPNQCSSSARAISSKKRTSQSHSFRSWCEVCVRAKARDLSQRQSQFKEHHSKVKKFLLENGFINSVVQVDEVDGELAIKRLAETLTTSLNGEVKCRLSLTYSHQSLGPCEGWHTKLFSHLRLPRL
eukprot:2283575-Amphidinium_carterae.3